MTFAAPAYSPATAIQYRSQKRSSLTLGLQLVKPDQHLYGINGFAEWDGSVACVVTISGVLAGIALVEEPPISITFADSVDLHSSSLIMIGRYCLALLLVINLARSC